MPRKVQVVEITDSTTYGDITEAVVETEKAENEVSEETKPEEVSEPEPPKPKAKAKRVSKPKLVIERPDTVVDVDAATETPEKEEIKPKPKRAAKVKVVKRLLWWNSQLKNRRQYENRG